MDIVFANVSSASKRKSGANDLNPNPQKRQSGFDHNTSRDFASEAPTRTPTDQYWMVQWRNPQGRKHKTWEGDGVLSTDGTHYTLQDADGKLLGRATLAIEALGAGSEVKIEGKEVEIDCAISRKDFMLGKCFNHASPSTPIKSPAPPPKANDHNSLAKRLLSTPAGKFTSPLPKSATAVRRTPHIPSISGPSNVAGKASEQEKENRTDSGASYWAVNWRKPQGKKNKSWDGDGVVSQVGKKLTFMDDKGKVLGSIDRADAVAVGSVLFISGKEIEVDAPISPQSFTTYFDQSPTKPMSISAAPQNAKFKQVKALAFYAKPAPEKAEPRYDPTALDALVMPEPSKRHQAKYNKSNEPVVPVVVDPLLSRHLRAHQREGVQFMYESVMGMRKHEGNGCILADEMGLGKTLQTIALMWTLLKQNPYQGAGPVIGKALIVCPVSLVNNWKKEILKWLGRDRMRVFLGDKDKTVIKQFLNSRIHDVLIIGYERLRTVIDELAYCTPPIGLIVCDEGHRLKAAGNKTSKMFEVLKTPRRIILSGTPIQNDLSEFHAMADFCNPGLLDDYKSFSKMYEGPITKSRAPECTSQALELGNERSQQLQKITQSFVLRRTAEILSKFLPPKYEYVVFVKPTVLQLSILRTILSMEHFNALVNGNTGGAFALIGTLTKICNSPILMRKDDGKETTNPHVKAAMQLLPAKAQATDVALSGKLIALFNLLRAIHQETDEKCIVVSHYTATLDVIEEMCKRRRYPLHRLDGSTKPDKRQAFVDDFNKCPRSVRFIFLLSSKAGGVGLNLVGASRLILIDSDWNPSHDLQSMARIHRDGQKRTVHIYRLLTTGTIDEKIYQRQVTKTGLSESLMANGGTDAGTSSKGDSFSQTELRDLFTVRDGTLCHTHDLLGCTCDSGEPSSLSASGDDDDDDEQDAEVRSITRGFQSASQVKPEKGDKRKKKKKAELAALDSWTHINTALASARDAVSDPVLQTLLPPPTTCPPAIRLDGSDDEEVRRDLGDIPAGAMTFLFSRVKMNPEPEALLV